MAKLIVYIALFALVIVAVSAQVNGQVRQVKRASPVTGPEGKEGDLKTASSFGYGLGFGYGGFGWGGWGLPLYGWGGWGFPGFYGGYGGYGGFYG